ncbi:MAG: hypothetical protein ABFD08_17705 [Syntrophomonas sp.]
MPEWNDIKDLWAEVQVRSILQHAWAVISHSFLYKSKQDMPKELVRKLYRLSALFELADDELNSLIEGIHDLTIKYTNQIQERDESVELNINSLIAFMDISNSILYWEDYIRSLGYEMIPYSMVSRDIDMLNFAGISTVAKVDNMLLESKEWGQAYFRELFEKTLEDYKSKTLSIVRNGIVTMLLIGNYPDIFTEDVLDKKFGWHSGQRALISAYKYNPKYNANK